MKKLTKFEKEKQRLNRLVLKKIKAKYGVKLPLAVLEDLNSMPSWFTTIREQLEIPGYGDCFDDTLPVFEKLLDILFCKDLWKDYKGDIV